MFVLFIYLLMCFDSRAACVLYTCMCVWEWKAPYEKVKGKPECCVIKRNQSVAQFQKHFEDLNKKAGISLQDHCSFL